MQNQIGRAMCGLDQNWTCMTPLPAVVYYHTDVWRKNNDMINAAETIKHDRKHLANAENQMLLRTVRTHTISTPFLAVKAANMVFGLRKMMRLFC